MLSANVCTSLFLERHDEPVDPDGASDAGELRVRVEAGEVVVAAAGADAADAGHGIQPRLHHDAGVVVEPARDRGVDDEPNLGRRSAPRQERQDAAEGDQPRAALVAGIFICYMLPHLTPEHPALTQTRPWRNW